MRLRPNSFPAVYVFLALSLTEVGVNDVRSANKARKPALADQYGDPLPEGAVVRMGTTRLRQPGRFSTLTFSPDGRFLASDSIWLWEAATGKVVRRIDSGSYGVCFTPDSKTVIGGARLWDVNTGKEIRQFATPESPYRIALSSDGRMLATCWPGNPFRVWHVATGKELGLLPYEGNQFIGMAWVGGTTTLAAFCLNGSNVPSLRLWDVATGKVRRLLAGPWGRDAWQESCLAASADGKTLAYGNGRGDIVLLDVATGKDVGRLRVHSGAARLIQFSADGYYLASVDELNTIQLWRRATGKATMLPLKVEGGWITALAFSPDSKTLATPGMGNEIRLWDVATGRQRLPSPEPLHSAYPIAFSPDGKTLLATGDNHLWFWDAATGRQCKPLFPDILKDAVAWALSPDGKVLAAGNSGQSLEMWEVATGKNLATFKAPPGRDEFPITNGSHFVAFAPDANLLAAGNGYGTLALYKGPGWNKVWEVTADPVEIGSLAWSPDRKLLATTRANGGIQLWDTATGTLLRKADIPTTYGTIAFSPDGRTLATRFASNGGVAQEVALWEVSTLSRRGLLPSGLQCVHTVRFSPDGKLLAAVDWSGLVLWDRLTGEELRRFREPRWMSRLVFSPDGTRLATGSYHSDATLLVWDTASCRPKKGLRASLTPEEAESCWRDLAGEDAEKAYGAIRKMVGAAGQSVRLLRERLRPTPAADPSHIARLLVDLESERLPVRQKAATELENLGESARPALQKAFATAGALEYRRRLAVLLDRLSPISAESLRAVRAVEILEGVASPEACQVLQSLVTGMPEALLTNEARASLERLEKWNTTKPR